MSTPLIGVSKSMLKIKELINHVANTCLNVLGKLSALKNMKHFGLEG